MVGIIPYQLCRHCEQYSLEGDRKKESSLIFNKLKSDGGIRVKISEEKGKLCIRKIDVIMNWASQNQKVSKAWITSNF